MKKQFLFLSAFLVNFVCLEAQLIKTENGIVLKNFGSNTVKLRLEVVYNNIIHIIASPAVDSSEDNLTPKITAENPQFSLKIIKDGILIKTDSLQVFIDSNNGKVTFRDKANNLLLQEDKRLYKSCKKLMKCSWSVKQEFKWSSDESLYTFGLESEKDSNIRGRQFDLQQPSSSNFYPLISSSKGYGILWFNNSLSQFCDIDDNSYLWSEKAKQVDYYFLYAQSTNELMTNYKKLTSELTILAKNSLGYIQSKDCNGVQAEASTNDLKKTYCKTLLSKIDTTKCNPF